MRYVEAIDARAVVPSAGPPAFLDDELWHLNVIRGDELSIFPDQRAFLGAARSGRAHAASSPSPAPRSRSGPTDSTVTHPIADADVQAIFDDKESYLRHYQDDWKQWLHDLKAAWKPPTTDLARHAAATGGSRCCGWPRRCARRSAPTACSGPASSSS